ncbi:IS200/IS605 family transposase [Cuspidothrix issatschenkoi]|jgi:putative transposase|uniref:IS200/IS605 family transposase n=1 Tax=Cuspidothrix issatschenkoi CHARLIE-1 TaxID=2052836 RepID=A0A2S6CTZ2_9CYAN|nr:IS200/IS605 family transposase [Cuspidothrix issatschenkoi]PPJ63248.1 IS200/IS605 family transposase [Cuspidothrix issatschenkoi CHARLIE-1]
MALWRLYYHIVWATKKREPLITNDIEEKFYGYLIGKADHLGCIIHAIGGMEDHIHFVASIPPKLSIAEFVKILKGSSAYHYNHTLGKTQQFAWQEGYGVFSLGGKQLQEAIEYVDNQKIHHQNKTTVPLLEQETDFDKPPENKIKPKNPENKFPS